uniref:Polysaccharide biosynthesis protein C-terminal domain-containing protein n=1 Tax=Craspedostauros australis TaxID=1486917 RepID=A0A7R9WX34_9STRA
MPTTPPPSDTPSINLSDAIMEMTGKPTSRGESRRTQLKDDMVSFPSKNNANAAADGQQTPTPESAAVHSKLFHVLRRAKQASNPKHEKTSPIAFLSSLRRKKQSGNGGKDDATSKPSEPSFSVRGFLKNKFSILDLVRLPDRDIVKEFSPYVMPVTSTQFGRVSGYVAMSHVVASSLGTVSMAAQQVVVSLFYCLCPIADSLSLTAQSFVPGIMEHEVSRDRAMALRKTIVNFMKAGGLMGAAIVAAVLAIPLISGFFTSDAAVVALVNSVVPLLAGFFIVHGWMCSAEGLLLGQTDLGFLGKMYAAFCVAVPWLMLRVKNGVLSGTRPAQLSSVWQIFLGYQLFRVVAWVGRVAQLQRRTERAAEKAVPAF